MPGVGVQVWICRGCALRDSWPYPIVVAQQAIMGVGEGSSVWQDLVKQTLATQGVSREVFEQDVRLSFEQLRPDQAAKRERF
jgi:hypothetical protein